ncbi:MAG: cytochrome c3 family protein [Anaerolineales bacterium]|nr:cytochrome c3 family protein [Anaerolineales bacterium]
MHNNRLGCFTATGVIATFITLFVIVGFAFASGSQMFSAGALNAEAGQSYGGVTSHAQITECSACHAAPIGAETMADRCASCHTDIAAQMKDVAKLHGAITQKNSALACRDCHPDHRGETASLTEMGENTFPHEALGFSLEGHQLTASREAFTCRDCHHEDVTTFAPDSCDSCHRQIDIAFAQAHVLSFGTDCLACHDGVDKFGDDFTHSVFAFQLNGKHADAACTKCHLDARTVADLQSAPQDCFSCHQQDDEHEGRFGQDCAACHSSDGWEPAKFDHNLSVFKLEGRHAEVKCEDCHVNNVFKGTPQDCYSCHQQDDEHNGAFGTDCSACHTPNNWDDAIFDHNLAAFKLEGEHVNVRCEQCHVNNVFKGTPQDCYSCHQQDDEHNGEFGTDCSACHTPNNWDAATIDHNLFAFKLDGAHAQVRCEECHQNGVFKDTPSACVSCHADPAFHAGALGTDCASCHNTFNWNQASYNLSHPEPSADEGGSGINHGNATCRQCHPSTVQQAVCTDCHEGGFEGGEDGDD